MAGVPLRLLLLAAVVLGAAAVPATAAVSRTVAHNGCALVPRSLMTTALGDTLASVYADGYSSPFGPLIPGLPRAASKPETWVNCSAHAQHDGLWSLSMMVGTWPSASDALTAFTVFKRSLYQTSGDARTVRPCRTVAGIGRASCVVPIVQPVIGGGMEPIGTLLYGVRGRVGVEVALYSGGPTAARGPNGQPRHLRPDTLTSIAKTLLDRVPRS